MSALIDFARVHYAYAQGRPVLSDISLQIQQGEMVYVTGSSGAGKTTLLRLIARLCVADRGQLTVMGQDLLRMRERQVPAFRQHIGLVFQNYNLLNDRSVFDNVALPLVIRGYAQADIGRRVRAALDALGLLKKERQLPLTLSGGEQQRVGIARAIVTKPALILADEPTGNLDPDMSLDVFRGFDRFNQAGVTVLIATHATDLIDAVPHRVIHLEGGRLADLHAPDSARGGPHGRD